MYDYLIVGAGLFGAVFAREATNHGKRCLVIDKRNHIAGNIYTEEIEGIQVHKYGAHIFHTSDDEVWRYVNNFSSFNHYINSPVAIYKNELYNLPFNMNTFSKMWNIKTPSEARDIINRQIETARVTGTPTNLEEQALQLVGHDVYEKLVKGYTEKQWGKSCTELPAFIIKRLPVRFIYDNNYFNDPFQGIPIEGYTQMVKNILDGIDIKLETDYHSLKNPFNIAKKVIYTGMIDRFYDYQYGELEYRSLRFEEELLPCDNYQGNAVINYTEREIPYTRIIEHKHFSFGKQSVTVITKEYPCEWEREVEPYYPINNEKNNLLYEKYKKLSYKEKNVLFGGRLGGYQYMDMDKIIRSALDTAQEEFN